MHSHSFCLLWDNVSLVRCNFWGRIVIKWWGFFIAKKRSPSLPYYELVNDNFVILPKFLLTTADFSILNIFLAWWCTSFSLQNHISVLALQSPKTFTVTPSCTFILCVCPKTRGRSIKHDHHSVFLKLALYFRNQTDCDTKLVFPFGNRS